MRALAGVSRSSQYHESKPPGPRRLRLRRVQSEYADKIERILARLEELTTVDHMSIPGFRLHP